MRLWHHIRGQPLEKIQHDTERDYFMSSAEAQAYGLIDEVIARSPSNDESGNAEAKKDKPREKA